LAILPAAARLTAANTLLLALFDATRAPGSDDARHLAARLKAAALAAAEDSLSLLPEADAAEIEAAGRRLREVCFGIEVARCLGYFDLGLAAELLALAAAARSALQPPAEADAIVAG
jgi:hypothetical protein